MNKTIIIACIGMLFCCCEDKKNNKNTSTESLTEDTLQVDKPVSESDSPKEKDYSLTDKTVVAFLEEYGKNNTEHFITILTPKGAIELELYNDTPLHRANFIFMVKNGFLETTMFHRVIKDFIIQGGGSDRLSTARMKRKIGRYTLPAEIKYPNVRGALAAAKEYRDNPDDRSSAYEFYIVQGRKGAPHLNSNYTVFGRVVAGMDVVDAIAKAPVDERDWPIENIDIKVVITEVP